MLLRVEKEKLVLIRELEMYQNKYGKVENDEELDNETIIGKVSDYLNEKSYYMEVKSIKEA